MKKLLLFIFTLCLYSFSFSFHISPDGFGKRIDGDGGFQEYTFENKTGKTIRYRFAILPGRNPEKSMDKWIEFEPKFMTIKNGESKKLKLYAKSPPEAKIGDYSFYLAVNSVTIPGILEGKEGEVTTGSTVGINMHIEMLGWVGDLPAKLKLEKYNFYEKDEKVYFKGFVNNHTEKRFVRYMIEVIGNHGERATLYGGVLPSKHTKSFDVHLPQFKKKSDIWKIEVRETLDRNLLQTLKL
ncbi:hypothetical protein SAMN02745174_01384 [Cetobacterium ceti]|uniref:Pili and flagellar-assembly chaperone, PapD N-terminal domain n=1 Tax=Cetobacterium ceti TaxID=180163 RepID=A0A1T4MYM5_9FUSO|nr:hypothetical protein [Cetobacterium ceti]SJZ72113.1 hypothetical protein SAMN02745174_01384 [Cetobacterium ceti]